MSLLGLCIIAVGLSMDAFAVAVCKGLSMPKMSWKGACIVGLYFGGFQAAMPLLGYLLGAQFHDAIINIDHWLAFILLSMIGINMIREALNKEEDRCDADLDFKSMIPLAIATSIDALAVGVTFAFLQVSIGSAVWIIGSITCVLAIIGVKAGNIFGTRYKSKAEFAGGVVLILVGAHILMEHLFH
ncbi:MAG: manganese efflux pump MntP family protein [Lachnospiraceae bacterium]